MKPLIVAQVKDFQIREFTDPKRHATKMVPFQIQCLQ